MAVPVALLLAVFPAAAIWASKRNRVAEWMSPVVICYLFGILLANVGVVPPGSGASGAASALTIAMVLLAIPLLLFGADLRRWVGIARPTVVSFGLAMVSISIVAGVLSFVFTDLGAAGWKVAGMTVGVYTGGTANMAAIGTALDVPEATFVALNAADVVVSSLYLVFLMSVAQRVLLRFLPAFRPATLADGTAGDDELASDDPWAYRPRPAETARALGLAVLVVAVAVGVAFGVAGGADTAAFDTAAILGITTLGIAASFVPRIREMPGTYEVGQYLFLVFAVAVGTLANIAELAASFTTVFPYVAVALGGAVALHFLLAAIFRIDADTAIITSTAAVFGPPFVGPIAATLKNREIVVSGLTTGVVGLAVGNYAGLAVAYLLR